MSSNVNYEYPCWCNNYPPTCTPLDEPCPADPKWNPKAASQEAHDEARTVDRSLTLQRLREEDDTDD